MQLIKHLLAIVLCLRVVLLLFTQQRQLLVDPAEHVEGGRLPDRMHHDQLEAFYVVLQQLVQCNAQREQMLVELRLI